MRGRSIARDQWRLRDALQCVEARRERCRKLGRLMRDDVAGFDDEAIAVRSQIGQARVGVGGGMCRYSKRIMRGRMRSKSIERMIGQS